MFDPISPDPALRAACRRTAERLALLDHRTALQAMAYAALWHRGRRKDGSPEFSHQLWIAEFLLDLGDAVVDPDAALAAAFLHDAPEDYDVPFHEIERRFGARISRPVRLTTKRHRGRRTPDAAYYGALPACPTAALVKCVDRTHNVLTMQDAFSPAKAAAYVAETDLHVLPMAAAARLRHPAQRPALDRAAAALRSALSRARVPETV